MISRINLNNPISLCGILFAVLFLFLPVFTYSTTNPSDATRAGETGIVYECGDGEDAGNCGFNDLIEAVKKAINFAVTLTLSFSVVVIAWVGGEYLFYADNPGKRAAANERLVKVVKGIVFILAAWLIVTLIANALLKDTIPVILQ